MTNDPNSHRSVRDRPPFSASWLTRLIDRLEINRTIIWAVLTRGWQILAGAVSFVLITSFLTPHEQGYYVTFWSFLALQSLVDLGFTIAILNFSSHEWTALHLDERRRIVGDGAALSRLVSLGRTAFLWFGAAAVCFLLAAGGAGQFVFSARPNQQVEWQLVWWLAVCCSALSFWTMPFLTILEGCGQIETVYRFRLWQAVLNNFAVWTSLALGLGLWTALASTATRLITELYMIFHRYRLFFVPFLRPPASEIIRWREQIWPMQWRLAVGGVFNYFAVFLFAPLMFLFHSEQLAGRMGMTRQLLTALQSASQAWVQARVPLFGQLVAKRDFHQLDAVFRRVTIVSTAVLLAGGAGFLLFLFGLEFAMPKLAERVLAPFPTAIMFLAMVVFQLPWAQTLYLRAHRQEPVMMATLISNLSIATGVGLLGISYADMGAAFGHLLPVMLITVPMIHRVWRRCRTEWHGESPESR